MMLEQWYKLPLAGSYIQQEPASRFLSTTEFLIHAVLNDNRVFKRLQCAHTKDLGSPLDSVIRDLFSGHLWQKFQFWHSNLQQSFLQQSIQNGGGFHVRRCQNKIRNCMQSMEIILKRVWDNLNNHYQPQCLTMVAQATMVGYHVIFQFSKGIRLLRSAHIWEPTTCHLSNYLSTVC